MHRFAHAASILTTAAACLVLGLARPADATPVTQTTAPTGSQSSSSWNWQPLGSITLANGTNTVSSLTSTVTLADQGWGGQDPADNQVIIGLFDNGAQLWGQHVAGASHTLSTQSYDISSTPTALQALNTALAGIVWATGDIVTMQMEAVPLGYPGWQLDTQNASFSMISNATTVPEPSALAVFAFALASLAYFSRLRMR